MGIKTIDWKENSIKIIDQTLLPGKLEYLSIRDLKTLWSAIRQLKVRGAPVLGAAAGLGVYLGIKDSGAADFRYFFQELEQVIRYLGSARPTARNLFWGLERMKNAARENKSRTIKALKKILFTEALKIIEEDRFACRKIGFYGAKLLKNGDNVLTVCNAGILATIDYGTALGVVYRAKHDGKKIKVFACETRPLLQGARLTTWELKRNGVDVTLLCDNMAAVLMNQGKIDKVITGADRIVCNGDAANKIGSYSLAILCKHHKIPFYIAAPFSTFDLNLKTGKEIIIEERRSSEVTDLFFKKPVAPKGIKVFNPAFDVTPHEFINAIITERGVIRPPFQKNIAILGAKI
ncbi:MAG: S-methyl-5-thioribose-1-phosphate isomerase [Candidatus Omnitrophica bacterium]|nr:S-methyl-5-thioribose-1-phosphate isomerase [Candidatus Omnitrophota bacterium]